VSTMPGTVRPVADERDGLLSYLAQQRYVIRLTAYGLTDDQARRTPTVSTLSIGGLLKHVAFVETGWIDQVLRLPRKPFEEAMADHAANFVLAPGETLDQVLSAYGEVAARTETAIAEVPDLGQAVPVPKDSPWFPRDVAAWSVRWVLLHLIQETARHAGHADLVRESLDGATAFPLMAAAEGWPAMPWMTPWSPAETPG
jgi:uncharacterized damage-inducible protein DinB